MLVALVGFALVAVDPPVAVILPYYGLLFAVATPLLGLRTPALAALAAVWCVAGPVASHVLRAGRRALPGDQVGFGALAAPADALRELALTGYYPVLPWMTYLLAGMAVGRGTCARPGSRRGCWAGAPRWRSPRRRRRRGCSARAAAPRRWARTSGSAATGRSPPTRWWWLAVEAPHTGTPFDLAHTTGTALAVLGAALLVAWSAPWVLWPLAAVGALPLTLYTLHVTALALFLPEAAEAAGGSAAALLVVHLVAALVIGVLVRLAGLRGPLEAGVGAVSGGGAARGRGAGAVTRRAAPG